MMASQSEKLKERAAKGGEREFAKYTFSCKIREDSTIIKAINRYPTSGFNAIEQNPETIVIYENSITNEVDYMSITTHFSGLHSYFGFMYKFKPENMALLKPNAAIKAGTIFADSPSVDVDGGYKTGIELETAYLSMPENDEDGVIFCEDTKPQLTFPLFASRVIEFGSKTFLLNLRGDDKVYKPMPDIGEYLSDDNILAAAREYDPAIAGSMMNSKWLRQVDYRGLVTGRDEALAEVAERDRWIPVGERLPETREEVLVACPGGEVMLAVLSPDGSFWAAPAWELFPTHWRPLPGPPEMKP
jgi:hypothetical protein